MQCFICVTYMIIFSGVQPTKTRELSIQQNKRSLFRDVIESLRIHSQIPGDTNENEDNHLAQNYDKYNYEKELSHLPSDAEFIPRRNDRIEMPSLKYRFPKSIVSKSDIEVTDSPKEEIVVYIDTTKEPKPSTQKPKKQKRPRPPANKIKNTINNKDNEGDIDANETQHTDDLLPMTNTMTGQSHIGNRESQMVVKPTVIVNFRGTVSHRDSDIRLEGRKHDNVTKTDSPQNVFNINQEIKLERTVAGMGSRGVDKRPNKIKQAVEVMAGKVGSKAEVDMFMCETATSNRVRNDRDDRKYDNVLQILLSV